MYEHSYGVADDTIRVLFHPSVSFDLTAGRKYRLTGLRAPVLTSDPLVFGAYVQTKTKLQI